jgi:thiamine kinase-like enzyme
MTGIDLQQRVLAYFRAEAGRFGLDSGSLTVQRLLNWGGFVSHSYRVGDGRHSVHAKLATDQNGLRRWLAVHDRLEGAYHAPPVLAWVDLPGTPFGGLVFEHIDGDTWDKASQPGLLHDLEGLLGRLHEDGPLAERLGDGPRSYRACWELRYREQFEEDLKTVRACRPAFVTDARVAWMEEEARVVLALPAGDDAFAGVTRSPCHWDLWPDNVLIGADGRSWVLDWDGLAVGDEAEDLATLVWPFVHATGQDWRELLGGARERDGPFAARMDLHLRAIALDYLIDVLADWADCDVPQWRDEVRRRKEEEHRRYFDWYRSRWG